MTARIPLYGLLLVVAAAAAVLSFAALRDLALDCGFDQRLAWLLPVVVDAGAAAGSLVWLTRPGGRARTFGRNLALVLLGSSVAGNAIGHALDAYTARPHWALVVAVSGVAPAVLGAVVHLAVLVGRPAQVPLAEPFDDDVDGTGDLLDERGLSRLWDDAPPARDIDNAEPADRAAELIAAGAGRRRLSRELGLTEHEARSLLAASRNGQVTR